jgi:hypothetical protein
MFGWITNKYEFLPTEPYGHLAHANESPYFEAILHWIPDLHERKAEIDDIFQQCTATTNQEETTINAEWHCYEMAEDDLDSEMADALYKSGWVRVGSWNKTLHFEGLGHIMADKKTWLEDFANEHGFEDVEIEQRR